MTDLHTDLDTDLEQSADTALTSSTMLASLGSATVVQPPPEINALLWALDTLGWDAEAVPTRSCGATAGAPPAMAAARTVSPLALALALPLSTGHAHPSGPSCPACGCASSLSHWRIAARPRIAVSPVEEDSEEEAGTWELCFASEWDRRLRACDRRQVS